MKNKMIEGLTKQLGMSVGSSFTLRNIAGEYIITDDGIVKDGRLISQQELLHVLYCGKDYKSKLYHVEVSQQDRFKELYPLFSMHDYVEKFKGVLFEDDNSAQDAVDIISVEWAYEIMQTKFNMDCIAPYIEKALKQKDVDIVDMNQIFKYTLEYIFDEFISVNIIDAITFNYLVDYATTNNINVTSENIWSIIDRQLDYTSCRYNDALDELKEEIKNDYTGKDC